MLHLKRLSAIVFTLLFSCCEIPDKKENPEYTYAEVIIDASPGNSWQIGLMNSGENLNSTLIKEGNSEDNNYNKLIYKNKPFVVVINISDYRGVMVISTFIDSIEQEDVIIDNFPTEPLVIIYKNGDSGLASVLAKEIKFKSKIIII